MMFEIFSLSPSILTVFMASIIVVVTPSRFSTFSIHTRWAALAKAENLKVPSTKTARQFLANVAPKIIQCGNGYLTESDQCWDKTGKKHLPLQEKYGNDYVHQ
jgi:hypothetical protein